MDQKDGSVNNQSPPEAKIALFRSLFRGRNDVYPRRFESRKTGKSGYQPACTNEWTRGLCDKRAVRCAECAKATASFLMNNSRPTPTSGPSWQPSVRSAGPRLRR